MVWLLIAGVILMLVSPILWMRSSPRQRHIESLREFARSTGMQVILHRRPDAREDEDRLETVCYRLPWRGFRPNKNWVLHRHSQRGWESRFSDWHWFIAEAHEDLAEPLLVATTSMPESVSAVLCSASGIGVTWAEREDTEALATILHSLSILRDLLEKKHLKP